MGNAIKISFDNFKCRSSCSLNDDALERLNIQRIMKKLEIEELKDLMSFREIRNSVPKVTLDIVHKNLQSKYSTSNLSRRYSEV